MTGWLSVVDFASFYLGIPIHAAHHPYLRFYCPKHLAWKRLTRMPFGARLAPFYCSVVSAECVDGLRGHMRWQLQKHRRRQKGGRRRREPPRSSVSAERGA